MTARKRLAILGSRGIPARYGGFETFAEQLSVRLVDRGFDVTVFCECQEEGPHPESHRGVELVHVRAPSLGPLSTIVFDLKCLWRVRKSFDVAYMLGYGVGLFLFVPRLWGCEVWTNMDGIEWSRSKWNWLAKGWLRFMERAATWTSDRLIADARGIRTHLEARYRVKPEISVIPYGADVPEKPPDDHLIDEYAVRPYSYYLVVCRLEPENHVLEILQGFAASQSANTLVIVGDVTAGTQYVRSLSLIRDDRVRFVGTVYDQAKLQALRWYCRAYFHGHSVGGTNPSLLEALACGNLVIAHDNDFNREVAGDCARYFRDASDIPEILRRIETASAPDSQRARSQARVRENYDWEKVADAYASLLRQ